MNARTDHGVFVAVVRWMRANGFGVTYYEGSFGSSLAASSATCDVELDEVSTNTGGSCLRLSFQTTDLPQSRVYLTSPTQAIDHLVTAGVLPDEFASWATKVAEIHALNIIVLKDAAHADAIRMDEDRTDALRAEYEATPRVSLSDLRQMLTAGGTR